MVVRACSGWLIMDKSLFCWKDSRVTPAVHVAIFYTDSLHKLPCVSQWRFPAGSSWVGDSSALSLSLTHTSFTTLIIHNWLIYLRLPLVVLNNKWTLMLNRLTNRICMVDVFSRRCSPALGSGSHFYALRIFTHTHTHSPMIKLALLHCSRAKGG